MSAAVIFAAAPLAPGPRLKARLSQLDQPFVVAADNGATTALAFGLRPDVVLGDFDSVEPATLNWLESARVPVETYPRDKDATDGELAIGRALKSRPTELFLVGFLGGPRLDHELANVLLLSRLDIRATLLDEQNECTLIRPHVPYTWRTDPGEIVSLLPITGDTTGVSTRGLHWVLAGERLLFGDTRGVSNEASADEASVSIASGLMLLTRHFPGGSGAQL